MVARAKMLQEAKASTLRRLERSRVGREGPHKRGPEEGARARCYGRVVAPTTQSVDKKGGPAM